METKLGITETLVHRAENYQSIYMRKSSKL